MRREGQTDGPRGEACQIMRSEMTNRRALSHAADDAAAIHLLHQSGKVGVFIWHRV